MKLAVSVAVWLSVMSTAIAGDTTAATAGTPSAGNRLLQGMKQMLSSERQEMTAQHNEIKQMLTSKQQAAPSSYSMGPSGSSVELLAIKNKLMALETKLEATQTNQKAMQTRLEAKLEAAKAKQEATEAKLQATQTKLQATQTKLQATQTNQRAMQTRLEAKLQATQTKLQAAKVKQDATEATLKMLKSDRKSGSTFVHWGRKTCSNSSRLVYSGVAGGSWWNNSGAASNPLCLTMKPQFDGTLESRHYALLYGAEYQDITNHQDHDVPCSVCHAPHSTTIMIPATHVCPKGWTTQYTGHITAGLCNLKAASQYVCLDKDPENANKETQNQDGYLFSYTVTRCGSLPCPPYVHNQVVLCVVCSK